MCKSTEPALFADDIYRFPSGFNAINLQDEVDHGFTIVAGSLRVTKLSLKKRSHIPCISRKWL